MSAALELRDLSKAFGGVRAVDRVSLRVAAGEIVALIGPNGAGKSTVFNLVHGQVRADAGEVWLAGVRWPHPSPVDAFARGIGRTFQTVATFRSLSVRQNAQVAIAGHAGERSAWHDGLRSRVDAADALLARVGLAACADRPAASLAYAQTKRLEFALALANAPRLLLLDEPTAGMGDEDRRALMTLVREAAEGGAGVLFTEHSMDVVFGHAHRIDVLARGRLIASGAPATIADDARVREAYLGSMDLAEYVR